MAQVMRCMRTDGKQAVPYADGVRPVPGFAGFAAGDAISQDADGGDHIVFQAWRDRGASAAVKTAVSACRHRWNPPNTKRLHPSWGCGLQTVKKDKYPVTVIRRRQTTNRKSASPIGAVNGAMPLRGDFRAFP